MDFNTRLKEIRKSKKEEQATIAQKIGITKQKYQRLEANSKPDYDTLIAIADYFDISLDYLVGRSDEALRY